MKRKLFFVLVLLLLGLIGIQLVSYLDRPPYRGSMTDWTCHRHVAHALGAWQDRTYTNSLEAFEKAYDDGFRVFEVDLELTTDGVLAATHGWPGAALSLDEFRQSMAQRGLTSLTLPELLALVAERADTYLILDTKGDPLRLWGEVGRVLDDYGPSVRDRLIPQLYSLRAREVRATATFPRVLLTLYRTYASDRAILGYLDRTGISVVTLPPKRWNPRLAQELRRRGVRVYVHTINDRDTANAWFERGIHGVYTDSLEPPATPECDVALFHGTAVGRTTARQS